MSCRENEIQHLYWQREERTHCNTGKCQLSTVIRKKSALCWNPWLKCFKKSKWNWPREHPSGAGAIQDCTGVTGAPGVCPGSCPWKWPRIRLSPSRAVAKAMLTDPGHSVGATAKLRVLWLLSAFPHVSGRESQWVEVRKGPWWDKKLEAGWPDPGKWGTCTHPILWLEQLSGGRRWGSRQWTSLARHTHTHTHTPLFIRECLSLINS